jgi:uncharacterized protein (UPF0276 family)
MNINNIKQHGVGIGFREEISKDIFKHRESIECVEIITERYIYPKSEYSLKRLSEQFKIVPHGVSLSIALSKLEKDDLKKIKRVCDIVQCEYYSEHLCLSGVPGIDLGHLTPIVMNERSLANIIKNINTFQDYIERPLVLENITYDFQMPGNEISQEQFFHSLVKETNCGVLLDLANIHTNSYNHHFDPYLFIDNMPLQNIVQVHLAGGSYSHDKKILFDSHNNPVEEKTWILLDYLLKKTKVKTIILEHDSNFPEDFEILLSQLRRVQTIQQIR